MTSLLAAVRRWFAHHWRIAVLVVGVTMLAVIVAVFGWPPVPVSLRKLRLSEKATDYTKDALVSAAGAILASTAIGISLATFFIQQNVERIPYRAVLLISRQNRIISYLIATVALALVDYCLAALLTPRNALAIAIVGILIILAFAYVVARFFLDNIRLLDPIKAIGIISGDRRQELDARHAKFVAFVEGVRQEVQHRPNERIEIGHQHEENVLQTSGDIRDIADGFVEEMVPQVRVLAHQGDYRAANRVCMEIAEICVAAISRMEEIYSSYKTVTGIWFESRLSFLDTFNRPLAIAQEARESHDPNLFAVVIAAYSEIALRLMPLVKEQQREDNSRNAAYAILQLSNVALASVEMGLVDVPVSCIAAYGTLAKNWNPEFPLLLYILRREVAGIVNVCMPMRGSDLTVDRGLTHQSVIKTTYLLYQAAVSAIAGGCNETDAALIMRRWKPFD